MFSSELFRALEGLVSIGIISAVDHDKQCLRVIHTSDEGDEETAWLPWPADVGKNYIRWCPLRLGTQVILLSESGDLANATIVGMLYTKSQGINPPSNNPDIDRIEFDDGTFIEHDINTHRLTLSAMNEMNLVANTLNLSAQTLNLSANTMNVNVGNTHWSGNIHHSSGDLQSNNVSVHQHTHKENGAGSNTNTPNASE